MPSLRGLQLNQPVLDSVIAYEDFVRRRIKGTLRLWLSGTRRAGPITDAATGVPFSVMTNRAYTDDKVNVFTDTFASLAGWTETEGVPNTEISIVGSGEGHGGGGAGAVNIFRASAGSSPTPAMDKADVQTKGDTFRARINISKASNATLLRDLSSGGHFIATGTVTGQKDLIYVAKGTSALRFYGSTTTDFTMDDIQYDRIGRLDADSVGNTITYEVESPLPGELAVEFAEAGYWQVGNQSSLSSMTTQKMAFLVNLDDFGENGVFFNWGTAESSHYLRCSGNALVYHIVTNGTDMHTVTQDIVDDIAGSWVWICPDYDDTDSAGNGRIGRVHVVTVDGPLGIAYSEQTPATGIVTTPTADCFFWNVAADNAGIDGKVSQVLVFDGALWSPGELAYLASFLAG